MSDKIMSLYIDRQTDIHTHLLVLATPLCTCTGGTDSVGALAT
jgi:hypothetical protein